MSLTLYYHPLSSFCHKALIALYEKNVEFDKRLVNLADPGDKAELQALWPFGKFPVLRDDERQREVPEASVIIEYLDQFYPGRQPLIPSDRNKALTVRLWDRIFDNYIHLPMQQFVFNHFRSTKVEMTKEQVTILTAYRMVDSHMASRTWVDSNGFGMADCAASPALFYASTVQPFPTELAHLRSYFERLMKRPSIGRVIDEAKPYFSYFPFASAIPPQYL
jgi:glutathione S-transferase